MTAHWLWRRARRESRADLPVLLARLLAFAGLIAVLVGARWAGQTAAALEPIFQQQVHVIVYLRDNMSAQREAALVDLLARVPGVDRVRAVTSAEALARLRLALNPLAEGHDLVDGVEEGFLPRSLELSLSATGRVTTRAAELATRLRPIDGVRDVDAMEEGLGQLSSWMGMAQALGRTFFVLAALATLTALAWTITQGRAARRKRASIMAMLGETRLAIRFPAALTGAAVGLMGAGLGLLGTLVVLRSLVRTVSRLLAPFVAATLPRVTGVEALVVLLAAVGAGAVTGYLSTPSWSEG